MFRAARPAAVGVLHGFRQRAEVPLAKVSGGVALFFQQLRQRQLLRFHVPAVGERDAVAIRVPAGDAAPARWAAHRCRRVKPVELQPRLGHRVEVRCADDFVPVEPDIPPPKVIAHDEDHIGFVCRLGCDRKPANCHRSQDMLEAVHPRQHSLAKRGGNSVAAAAPADRGTAAGGLDAAAVNIPLHHGAPAAVTGVELGDLLVVLGLGDFTALQRGGVFRELRLIGGLELPQFAIGSAAGEEQAGEKHHNKVENRFHDARRVRLAKRVVKQPTGMNPVSLASACF